MPKNVAVAVVNFVGRVASLLRGTKQARRSLRGFQKSVFSVNKALVGLTGALLGGGAFVAFRKQMSELVNLDVTSKKLGIATDKLRGFQDAARVAGIDLRTTRLGLQRFTRRVAEAQTETGTAREAMAELGLDAKKVGELPLDRQLVTVADALSKVADQNQRVRLGFQLLDSEGLALIGIMQQGGETVDSMIDEFNALRGEMDQMDVAGVRAASIEFLKLKSFIEGTMQTIVAQLAPALGQLTRKFTAWGVEARESSNWAKNAFVFVSGILSKIGGALDVLKAAWNAIQVVVGAVTTSFVGFFNEIIQLARHLPDFLKPDWVEDFAAESQSFVDEMKNNTIKDFEEMGSAWESMTNQKTPEDWMKFFDDLDAAGKDAAKAFEEQNKAIAEANLSAQQMLDRRKEFNKVAKAPVKFQQVDLLNMSIPGVSRAGGMMEVEDPQLRQTNTTLDRIEQNQRRPAVGTAVLGGP